MAINYLMTPFKLTAVLNNTPAFTNQEGFNDEGGGRANYLLGKDLDKELPRFDKVRTCGNAIVRIKNGIVSMFDGTKPPPLKTGFSQPTNLAQARIGIYQYTPQTNPELFFAAVGTRPDGTTSPFPQGVVYDWTGDGVPRVWLPHVSPVTVTWPQPKPVDNAKSLFNA